MSHLFLPNRSYPKILKLCTAASHNEPKNMVPIVSFLSTTLTWHCSVSRSLSTELGSKLPSSQTVSSCIYRLCIILLHKRGTIGCFCALLVMLRQISYDNNGWHSSHKPLLICRDDKKWMTKLTLSEKIHMMYKCLLKLLTTLRSCQCQIPPKVLWSQDDSHITTAGEESHDECIRNIRNSLVKRSPYAYPEGFSNQSPREFPGSIGVTNLRTLHIWHPLFVIHQDTHCSCSCNWNRCTRPALWG